MTSLADVGTGVISERRELHASGWKDCAYASAMRACADAGVTFPLADDLDAEREALERSDTMPDEQGATMAQLVLAMDTRYGYSGSAVSSMASAVRVPGRTLVAMGPFSRLPPIQRRWSSRSFGHAISYRVDTATAGTLLDPLAPMGFPGDVVPPDVIEHFCWGAASMRSMEWASMSIYVRRDRTGRFTIPAGKSVRGYAPAGNGWRVAKVRQPTPDTTSGPFDYTLSRLSGDALPMVLHHVTSGTFEDLYLDADAVLETLNPVPDPDVKHLATFLIDGEEKYSESF